MYYLLLLLICISINYSCNFLKSFYAWSILFVYYFNSIFEFFTFLSYLILSFSKPWWEILIVYLILYHLLASVLSLSHISVTKFLTLNSIPFIKVFLVGKNISSFSYLTSWITLCWVLYDLRFLLWISESLRSIREHPWWQGYGLLLIPWMVTLEWCIPSDELGVVKSDDCRIINTPFPGFFLSYAIGFCGSLILLGKRTGIC